jgi:hypothetical protein
VLGDQDGSRRTWWCRCRQRAGVARGRSEAGRLPHRPRVDLHGEFIHPTVSPARGPPVDGPGRVVFDNAAAEAFFSSLEWEVLSRHEFENTRQAQAVVLDWCYGFYNHERRHSSAGMMSPVNYENTAAPDREAA